MSRKSSDFTNQRIGNAICLEIISPAKAGKHKKWKCLCDCGNEFIKTSNHILTCVPLQCRTCSDIGRRDNHEIKDYYWKSYQRSAKQRNHEFNITKEYAYELFLKQNRKCAVSNIDICFCDTLQNYKLKTASLDRIDSTKGYIEGNVQWVHKTIQFMKQEYSQEEFIKWCKLVAANN